MDTNAPGQTGGILITQDALLPGVVKNRHMGEPNSYIFAGLDANRPTTGVSLTSTGFGASTYFATDTGRIYLWNGSTWLPYTPIRAATVLTGTTPILNLLTNNSFAITMTNNLTFSVSNVLTGMFFIVEVTQGSGTSYTNTWFSGVTWVTSGGTAPVETTTSSGITTYGFKALTTTTFTGYLVGTN